MIQIIIALCVIIIILLCLWRWEVEETRYWKRQDGFWFEKYMEKVAENRKIVEQLLQEQDNRKMAEALYLHREGEHEKV